MGIVHQKMNYKLYIKQSGYYICLWNYASNSRPSRVEMTSFFSSRN